jgi:hypothetical protein
MITIAAWRTVRNMSTGGENTEFCGAYPCVCWEKEEITARKSRGVIRFGAWAMLEKKGQGNEKKQLRCYGLSDFER